MTTTRHDYVLDRKELIYNSSECGKLSFQYEENLTSINCRLIEATLVEHQNHLLATHHHPPPFARIFLPVNGKAVITHLEQEMVLQPGLIYFFPSNLTFDADYRQGFSQYYIHVYYSDGLNIPLFSDLNSIKIIDNKLLYQNICQNSAGISTPHLLNNLLSLALILLEGNYESLSGNMQKFKDFSELLKFLDRTPMIEHTIANLAMLYSVSQEALSKRFRRKTGITLKKFLLEQKLQKIQELLLNRNYRIDEIAYQTGFSSPQYLHRFFKKNMGCTPVEYRNTHA